MDDVVSWWGINAISGYCFLCSFVDAAIACLPVCLQRGSLALWNFVVDNYWCSTWCSGSISAYIILWSLIFLCLCHKIWIEIMTPPNNYRQIHPCRHKWRHIWNLKSWPLYRFHIKIFSYIFPFILLMHLSCTIGLFVSQDCKHRTVMTMS